MNAPVVLPSPSLLDPFARANEAINAWRGRCIDSFVRVEHAVTETLAVLLDGETKMQRPHLIGQRLEALEKLLAMRSDAAGAHKALTVFRAHDPLRTYLSHGVGKVTVAQNGTWQVIFTIMSFRNKTLERTCCIVDEENAAAMTGAIGRDRQILVSQLASFRGSLAKTAVEKPLWWTGSAAG